MVILAGYSIAKRIFFREKTKKDNELKWLNATNLEQVAI